jgi:hypothetical protein
VIILHILPIKDLHQRDLECHVSSEIVSSVLVLPKRLRGTAHEVHDALMPGDNELLLFLFRGSALEHEFRSICTHTTRSQTTYAV